MLHLVPVLLEIRFYKPTRFFRRNCLCWPSAAARHAGWAGWRHYVTWSFICMSACLSVHFLSVNTYSARRDIYVLNGRISISQLPKLCVKITIFIQGHVLIADWSVAHFVVIMNDIMNHNMAAFAHVGARLGAFFYWTRFLENNVPFDNIPL